MNMHSKKGLVVAVTGMNMHSKKGLVVAVTGMNMHSKKGLVVAVTCIMVVVSTHAVLCFRQKPGLT